jgi:hypothetical protein
MALATLRGDDTGSRACADLIVENPESGYEPAPIAVGDVVMVDPDQDWGGWMGVVSSTGVYAHTVKVKVLAEYHEYPIPADCVRRVGRNPYPTEPRTGD